MNIKSLLCSFILLTGTSLYGKTITIENASSYNELRHAFKLACKPEIGMCEFDFLYFIEPQIQEAEKSLQAFSYCLHHPDKAICKKYLQQLANTFYWNLIHCVTSNSFVQPYAYNCQ